MIIQGDSRIIQSLGRAKFQECKRSEIEVKGTGKLEITGGRGPSRVLEFGGLYITATTETVLVEDVPTLCNTTSELFSQNRSFTNGSSRLTYTGSRDISVVASYSFTISSSTNQQIQLNLYKNGVLLVGSGNHINTANSGRSSAFGGDYAVDIENGDYLEVWVTNFTSGSSVFIEEGTFVVHEL